MYETQHIIGHVRDEPFSETETCNKWLQQYSDDCIVAPSGEHTEH